MGKSGKLMELDALADLLSLRRPRKKKVVHCHGVFDLLHIGHIRYFEQARRMGDILVVTVTPDRHVDKGGHRPAFTEELRAEAVASLDSVDFVAVNRWATAEETLRLLKPDVYVKGSEYRDIESDPTGKIAGEARIVREIGAELAFTEDIVFSSSNLINRYLGNLPEEIDKYLKVFRKRFDLASLVSILDRMAGMNVLVIGDTIIDEYQYCDAMGKSSKDPALALKYRSHDLFAGGVLAVANHVANFAKSVRVVSLIGEQESHETFIRSQLAEGVTPMFFTQPGAPTLIKRRYIDGYSFNKLFEVYVMDDSGLPPKMDREARDWVEKRLAGFDLVIAADFGHGAVSPEMVELLVAKAPFLAVNTQANAGNRGFHTISRYPRADFVSIAQHELNLELRQSRGDVGKAMTAFRKKMGYGQFVVTQGRNGCAVCDAKGNFVKVPAFAQNIVDRVGAGDAFLSVTALASVQGVDSEIIGFLGNIVGALAVEIIGNKKAIDRRSVEKYITSLMK